MDKLDWWKMTSLLRGVLGAGLVVLVTQGCQTDADGLIRVESNDLGVSHVQIERSAANGEKLLVVRGLDESGDQIALTTLRTGMVSYTSEPGMIPEEWSKGTELTVTVGQESMPLVTPTLDPQTVREPPEKSLASFVRLATVATEIQQEAGIRFVPRPVVPPGQEAAYAAGNCDASVFPTNVANPLQCCRESTTGDTWHKISGGTADGHIGYRTYIANACRNADGTTGCGVNGTQCTFGPCKSRNMWGSNGRGGDTNSKVFVPTSQPTVCGYQYYNDPTFGTVGSPETYVSQSLYPSVTASCRCNLCNLDGTPRCGFFDDFNRSSGMGSNWQVTHGTFSTNGSYAVSTAGATSHHARIIPAFNTSDYTITSNLSLASGSTESGVIARSQGTGSAFDDNYYEAVLSFYDGGQVELYRRNSGAYTIIGVARVTVTAGTFYTLKLVAAGTNPVHLEVYVNGTLEVVHDDFSASRHQTGYAGIVAWESTTQWNDIDLMPSLPPGTNPPAPPTGSPFIDDFSRTDTLGLGTNWITGEGGFTVNGTRAVADAPATGASNWCRFNGSVGSNNYSVETSMSVPTSSKDSGVFARSSSSYDPHEFAYTAWITTSGSVNLSRYNDWDETELQNVSTTITAGTFYTLKLVATGTNPVHLEVWLNGVKKIDYNDSSASRITSGGHGIFSYVTAGGVQWESYRADAL